MEQKIRCNFSPVDLSGFEKLADKYKKMIDKRMESLSKELKRLEAKKEAGSMKSRDWERLHMCDDAMNRLRYQRQRIENYVGHITRPSKDEWY